MQDNLIRKIKGGFNGWISVNYDYSAIQNPKHTAILKRLLTIKSIKTFLEIGTHEGLSSTYIADYCDRVITMDRRDYLAKYRLWYEFNKKRNIDFHLVETDEEKRELIESVQFDCAFIDGDHGEGVLYDWELVKHCGRVIFHDYKVGPEFGSKFLESYKHIIKLIESLPKNEVEICAPFAYWEKK